MKTFKTVEILLETKLKNILQKEKTIIILKTQYYIVLSCKNFDVYKFSAREF